MPDSCRDELWGLLVGCGVVEAWNDFGGAVGDGCGQRVERSTRKLRTALAATEEDCARGDAPVAVSGGLGLGAVGLASKQNPGVTFWSRRRGRSCRSLPLVTDQPTFPPSW